ncbi:MAG: hypothetical protein PF444_10050 [Bacteroidales bacterium]|jgi:hypothetical protein|nr:hypothetical protein [Bacteroidales bacterium]
MKALIKYSGVIIQLIGVALLLVPKVMGKAPNNVTLVLGGSLITLGVIAYIVINRMVKQ